tara:strand:- start:1926 stop:2603 length:678 start_codon:yes stop_codon:yes gene_type:complete
MLRLIDKKKNILIYLILLFILSTTSVKFTERQKNFSSKINKINVEGLSSKENLEILNELNILFFQNILFIKKDEVKKIIEQHNIIDEYNIKKIYPSRININIKPTKFLARISGDNHLLVGANGKLNKIDNNNEKLPYIFGVFNSSEFLVLKRTIEQSKFNFVDFKGLYFFPSYRWDILTNNDVLIQLPADNLLQSFNLAHKIISDDSFKNKNIIDLRVSSHLIVK